MSPVTIYTTDWCPYCRSAKTYLAARGIPFTEVDLTDDDDARAALTARTGRTSVPQVFVGDTHVGGYTDLVALDRAGGLDPLLASA